jgi:hypothetical protein
LAVIAAASILGACWLAVDNYRRTSLHYAIATTVLQIVLAVIVFPPLSFCWLIGDAASTGDRGTSGAQRQRRDDNKAGLSGYRPLR